MPTRCLALFVIGLVALLLTPAQLRAQTGDVGPDNAAETTSQDDAAETETVTVDPDFAAYEHPFGPWSIFPPVLAILIAIATRRIVLSLMLGILCGAVLLHVPAFNTAEPGFARYWDLASQSVSSFGEDYLWAPLTDGDLLSVFTFTMLMGAMVAVAHASGGMYGLVNALSPLAKTRRGGQLTGWGLGLVVFFDDYANTLLLGNTLRPTMDRLKISREKLAYIVDSTSAPIASIALVSTWVATELQYIGDGYDQLGLNIEMSTTELRTQAFLESIPYRFYAIMALAFVAIIAWMGRDFGPMLKAERRAAKRRSKNGDQKISDGDDSFHEEEELAEEVNADEAAINPAEETPKRWFNAVIPIAVTVGVTLWLIVKSGTDSIGADQPLMDRFQEGDSYFALRYGALAGLLVAAFSAWSQRLLSWKQIGAAAFAGAKMVLPALVILWLASGIKTVTESMSFSASEEVAVEGGAFTLIDDDSQVDRDTATILGVTIDQDFFGNKTTMTTSHAGPGEEAVTRTVEVTSREQFTADQQRLFAATYNRAAMERGGGLGTADYVGNVIRDYVTPFWMPTIVFVLAAGVAFATGTSWGTMGILTPLVVSVTYRLLEAAAGTEANAALLVHDPVLLASIGSVLAGAIFGDHCSPISDTTVLSSVASGCNHIAHVRTQMPYAIVVALLVIPFGTIPAGWGMQWYGALALMAICTLVAVGFVYWFGKPVVEDQQDDAAHDATPSPGDEPDGGV